MPGLGTGLMQGVVELGGIRQGCAVATPTAVFSWGRLRSAALAGTGYGVVNRSWRCQQVMAISTSLGGVNVLPATSWAGGGRLDVIMLRGSS
jgi:hypothetical protein